MGLNTALKNLKQLRSRKMTARRATHAGSWYTSNKEQLSRQLDGWLDQVPGDGLPMEDARIIIAPHAGYSYSGPNAAWAYKNLNVSKAKRVFLLGPSHHIYLKNAQLTQSTTYSTPLGPLPLDTSLLATLLSSPPLQNTTPSFTPMTRTTDEDEHSLEMHLPYIHKLLSRHFGPDPSTFPLLVPIMIGSTSRAAEKHYGALLAPYILDPANVFVVSSDFAHWGRRFGYTYYAPDLEQPLSGVELKAGSGVPVGGPGIWESVEAVDRRCMEAVEGGRHDEFLEVLERTGNTVCGRHPIGVVLAALEVCRERGEVGDGEGRFAFVRYDQSSRCEGVGDSSVSYASGVCRVKGRG